jgi:hypothetical protein
MSTTYTPNPANNPSGFTLPSDGDNKPVSSINPTLQGLADGLSHAQWPSTDATKSYPLASRHLTRVVTARPQSINGFGSGADDEGWNVSSAVPGAYRHEHTAGGAAADRLVFDLDLPDGATGVQFQVYQQPAAGHTLLPTNRIAIGAIRIDLQTKTSTSGSTTPFFGAIVAYEQYNGVAYDATALFGTIDRTRYRYLGVFYSEYGSDVVIGGLVYGAKVVFDTIAMDPGAA